MLLDAHNPQAIAQAAQTLAAGALLGLPTETVYGLAARADSDHAVADIFQAKGRPQDHPLILHVVDVAGAKMFAQEWPDVAQRLVDKFWPGPLTIIVPRVPHLAAVAAAGQATIGLRCPAHPAAQAVLQAAKSLGVHGVAAPSANRFGRISPTTAQHVVSEFGADLVVLDGGACTVGIESSIIDCSRGYPVLLRPGILTKEQIETAAGQLLHGPDLHAPKAPGTLAAHYAPRATLRLMPSAMLQSALQVLANIPSQLAIYSRSKPVPGLKVPQRQMPAQAHLAAQELFAVLRSLDTPDVQRIWVEEPPQDSTWDGVRDRLQRAAAASV
jgi:L-threonylcarbamoyladenylate synthase